ncbi:hypothetical protein AVEN_90976-1 [Araneus ventricosus]|uniref:Uncharacterized protein n=1 Tax=Araneus ventricosus TaxID=182803 RepID=A0A4Y2TT24_ARAVE|nr:hypothetical protein AVEN_90976-1 [Araneus ventricosus]
MFDPQKSDLSCQTRASRQKYLIAAARPDPHTRWIFDGIRPDRAPTLKSRLLPPRPPLAQIAGKACLKVLETLSNFLSYTYMKVAVARKTTMNSCNYCSKKIALWVYGVNSPTRRIMETEGLFTNMRENPTLLSEARKQ